MPYRIYYERNCVKSEVGKNKAISTRKIQLTYVNEDEFEDKILVLQTNILKKFLVFAM